MELTPISEPKCVYATLVMLSDNYVPGAAVLAASLRKVGSKYPIWCMVDSTVSAAAVEFLSKQFDRVIEVPIIEKQVIKMRSKKQNAIYGNWISKSFTKWHIFNPDLFRDDAGKPFDKVLFLDADMMIIENMDVLFNLPAPAATFSSPWCKPYVKTGGVYNPYGDKRHGEIVPEYQIKKGLNSIVGIGSCVLVAPSVRGWQLFMNLLKFRDVYGWDQCFSGFDEQILSEIFMGLKVPVHHIHPIYNWFVGKHDWITYANTEEEREEKKKTMKPKNYHYYNVKPWQQPRDAWADTELWWATADEITAANEGSARWFVITPKERAPSP